MIITDTGVGVFGAFSTKPELIQSFVVAFLSVSHEIDFQ